MPRLIIRNSQVFDGTSAQTTTADVLIEDAHFTANVTSLIGDDPSHEATRMLISQNADLFEISGQRSAYQAAELGLIAEGSWADVLSVDGNPLEGLSVLAAGETSSKVIIKNGEVVENAL